MGKGCGRKIGDFKCCTVVCCDCLEAMKALPDDCVDLVITDPPYGIGLNSHDDTKFRRWNIPIDGDADQGTGTKLLASVHELGLPVICFASPMKPWPGSWRQYLVWDKGNCVGARGDPSVCWQMDWELIQIARTGKLRGGRDSSILRFPVRPFAPEYDFKFHPAQKPVPLMEYLITKVSDPGELILDPFLGSGTTAVAAKKLGRHFLGFEISPEYCKIAEERIALVEAQPNLFDRGVEQQRDLPLSRRANLPGRPLTKNVAHPGCQGIHN